MSCSPFDLRDYFVQELAAPEKSQVEAHVRTCAECRMELDRLSLTEAALFSLREEEIPQRIAFVSDKIFEPAPWRRAWNAFWSSGARLGFAGAAMLSAAILVSALTRPVPIVQSPVLPAPAPVAQAVSESEIQARIDAAVSKAVAAIETRQAEATKRLIADVDSARLQLAIATDEFERWEKRSGAAQISSRAYAPPADEEVK